MEPLGRLALAAVAVVVAGCGESAAKPAARAVPLPTIATRFTPLPCPHSVSARGSTVGIEGCQEHTILRTNAHIRVLERSIFKRLSGAGRRRFGRGERAWLAYRDNMCEAEDSPFSGGTIQPVLNAACTADANRAHISTLGGFFKTIHPG